MLQPRHYLYALNRPLTLDHVAAFIPRVHALRPWRRMRTVRSLAGGPSFARILLAGAAVLALVKVMSLAGRPTRSRAGKLVLTALIIALGAIVVSFRRSARAQRMSSPY